MIFTSTFPPIDIPKIDILSFLFPSERRPSQTPIWHNAEEPNRNLSPAQLLSWVKRLSLGLDRLGIQQGEIVLLLSPNHIFVPVAYLGIIGGSRIFSAANPLYTPTEIAHQLRDSAAKTLLVHPLLAGNALAAAKQAGLTKDRVFLFDDKPCETRDGLKDWRDMIASSEDAEPYQWRKLHGEEAMRTVATVNYSSGTTGLPKGVCVSHYNLVANVSQTLYSRWPDLDHARGERIPARWLGFLPLYHAYGQLYANLLAAKGTAPIYIMRQFVYADFLKYTQQYGITELHVAPPILIMMNKRRETAQYDLSRVETILCGAAPLSKELQAAVARQFNCAVLSGWGMTELTCGGMLQKEPPYTGTVGKLVAGCECKLVDENGREVGYDEPGEIIFRGPQVCLGYFNNEEATREALSPDGWLKTGDVATTNKEGFFWIVDRKKELIKVNGLQVAPAELEAALLENEDVADAAVVGIQLSGEEYPRAYVQLREESRGKVTAEKIQEWMAGRVAKHKRLTGGVKFVDEVPRLPSGKIQRKVMRELAKKDASSVEKDVSQRPTRSKL